MTIEKRIIGGVLVAVAIGIAVTISGCSSTHEVEQLSAEKRFEHAMKLFDDGDYLEAYDEFRIVTLQYQGSSVADKAQYYMGECRFNREEFILAAYEYDVLIRTMPTSSYVPKARFRRAMCFYRLSPAYYLDQTYTRNAIDEFQSFIEYHPTDSLATEAAAKISELDTKLARKEYENGITYIHLDYFKSALESFDVVLEKYHDSPYADQAQLKKAEVMLMRNRPADAKTEIEKFFTKYPNSPWKQDAERVRQDILQQLGKGATAQPKAPAPSSAQSDISHKE